MPILKAVAKRVMNKREPVTGRIGSDFRLCNILRKQSAQQDLIKNFIDHKTNSGNKNGCPITHHFFPKICVKGILQS